MGGWIQKHPSMKVCFSVGLENPIDQIHSKSLFVNILIRVEGELLYLQENYNKNVDVNLVEL